MSFMKYYYDGKNKFSAKKFDTKDLVSVKNKEEGLVKMAENLEKIEELQAKLYAEGKQGVLMIFQAMDAGGKDGAIKHVMSGINPQGIDVYSFKQPSAEEASHDYLWRAMKVAPPRGKMAIFNRSYYEDVLVSKVHSLYKTQNLPERCKGKDIFEKRYEHIKNYEKYLYENGIIVVKVFLNISKDEQKRRFLERIEDKTKNWKFSDSDLKERQYWKDYQKAFETAINETATPYSPWIVVPADRKWYARLVVSQLLIRVLEELNPQYPVLPKENQKNLEQYKNSLLEETE
ncbi:MAG: polyphosphate kinase 2 family protein [Eubacteriaceae bacterium]